MALNVNAQFYGKDVDEVLVKAFKDTLLYTAFQPKIMTGYKCNYTFWNLTNNGSLQPYTACSTTPTSMTMDQRTGALCNFEFQTSMDKNALVCSARERFLAEGFNAESPLDDSFLVAAMTEVMLGTVAEQWDEVLLTGVATEPFVDYLDICDGLIQKFTDNVESGTEPGGTVIIVANDTVTTSNVLAELNLIYASVPASLKSFTRQGGRRLKFAVSRNIADAYIEVITQTQAGFNAFNPTLPGALLYKGYEMVILDSLPANTAFATYSDNIAIFVDGDGDFSEIRFWDKSDSGPCDEIVARIKFRSAIDFGVGAEIVWYTDYVLVP